MKNKAKEAPRQQNILIVVDMQNDFISGSLANPEAEAIIPKINGLISNNKFDKIIFTRDSHKENYLETPEGIKLPIPHCLVNTGGWQVKQEILDKAVLSVGSDNVNFLNKETFGYKYWDMCSALNVNPGDNVVLVGTCTDICVVSNALILKASFPYVNFKVVADCCAGLTKEKHEAALEVMHSCQIEVI